MFSMFCCSVPLKKWKCGFEETLGLQSISDWLPEIAALFSGSVLFGEIHAYVMAQQDISAIKNSDRPQNETDTKWTCDDNRNSNVCHVSDESDSGEYPTVSGCSQSTSDLLLAAISLPLIVEDSSETITRESDPAAVNNHTAVLSRSTTGAGKQRKSASASKKTRRHKLATSEVKPANSGRESRHTKTVVCDTKADEMLTAGSCLSAHAGNTQHSTARCFHYFLSPYVHIAGTNTQAQCI